MKNLTVVFKDDHTLSFDGINTKEYKKGEAYTASYPQEHRVFDSMVMSGQASVYAEQSKTAKPEETKVSEPTAKKTTPKKTAKK